MKLELNREYPELDDPVVFEKMVALTLGRMKPVCAHMKRGQHAKATGCVAAEFVVRAEIPPELQHGVLSQPGRVIKAIVRFSNSDGTIEKDGVGAARGMAIKLLDIGGVRSVPEDGDDTQDFLMIDNPVFPFPTPAEYLNTMSAIAAGEIISRPIGQVVGGFRMLIRAPEELRIAQTIRGKHVASPLELQYYSGSPYWLGLATGSAGHAIKYTAVSRELGRTPPPEDPAVLPPDYLAQAIIDRLRLQKCFFDFQVQLQTDAETMPVEDVSVEWDSAMSPPITVATLRIPAQMVDPAGELATRCEGMSFNPWHALVEHRPMGGMNRLRKAVYQASVAKRS